MSFEVKRYQALPHFRVPGCVCSAGQLKILKLSEVEERVGLKKSTIYSLMLNSLFPKKVPLSGKSVGWLESEVNDWISDRLADRVNLPITVSKIGGSHE